MRLGVVVPMLDEAAAVESTLARLAPMRARGVRVVVVDGGSSDATMALAIPYADVVVQCERGRALQMNTGAHAALECGAEALLFLHADSELPPRADHLIEDALRTSGRQWGRFDVRIDDRSPLLRIVATMMNRRSRLTGICTGDQAIFVTRSAFERLRGFAAIALMEDIEFSKRAKEISWPAAIGAHVTTSSRRWRRHGILRTIVLMWRFRLAYFFGTDPQRLARRYRDAR